jgi:hypothetical protein
MTWIAFVGFGAAWAGDVVMDTQMAASLVVDGAVRVEAMTGATLRLPLPDGEHHIEVRTDRGTVELGRVRTTGASLRLTVDESGLATWDDVGSVPFVNSDMAPVDPSAPIAVEFRSPGNIRLMVLLGKERFFVGPGEVVSKSLVPGNYTLGLRSADGTNVFARGMLIVPPGLGAQVVELIEGTLPRSVGEGLQFAAEGR